MKSRQSSKRKTRKKRKRIGPYPFEFRLQVVRLYLEEGYTAALIKQELGVSCDTIAKWANRYRQYGEQGLKDQRVHTGKSKTPKAVKKKIIGLKKSNPSHGSRRISDTLKRFFLIRTSPATVHRTLSEEGLVVPAKKKPKKNPAKPRFFLTGQPEPDVAKRYLQLPAGRQKRLPDRIYGRLLALYYRSWTIPQPNRRTCA